MKCSVIYKKTCKYYFESSKNSDDKTSLGEEITTSPLFAFRTKINADLALKRLPIINNDEIEYLGKNPENGKMIYEIESNYYEIQNVNSIIFYKNNKAYINIHGQNIPVDMSILLPTVKIFGDAD